LEEIVASFSATFWRRPTPLRVLIVVGNLVVAGLIVDLCESPVQGTSLPFLAGL
jgi:hypothetical protein